MQLEMNEVYIPNLTRQFSIATPILFTGAGFSLGAQNKSNDPIPSVDQLTKMIWNLCYPGDPYEEENLLKDLYDTALIRNRTGLQKLMLESFSVDHSSIQDWQLSILSLPWYKIYTLNIDDLAEVAAKKAQPSNRRILSVSGVSDNISEVSSRSGLEVVHLNGSIKDIPEKVVFSRRQYATTGTRFNTYYDSLAGDLMQRPTVFIGSSLDEQSLWEYIELRMQKGSRGTKEQRPRSFLIVPSLARSKIALLEKYNIAFIPMTGEEFANKVVTEISKVAPEGFKEIAKRESVKANTNRAINFIPDLISSGPSSTNYLQGGEPVWKDVTEERIVDRSYYSTILDEIKELLASSTINQYFVITGTAATGKTSAMMKVAKVLSDDGLVVGWLDRESFYINTRRIIEEVESLENLDVLFIDNADIISDHIATILEIAFAKFPRLLVALELRSSKVDQFFSTVNVKNYFHKELTIPRLTDDDIDSLIALLDRENRLGKLKGESHESRVATFKEKCGRILLVAMYEATSGKEWKLRAADELEGLSDTAKFIYGLTALVTEHRLTITRDEVVLAAADKADNEFLSLLDGLTSRQIIKATRLGPDHYSTRHRVIAELVCDHLRSEGRMYGIVEGLLRVGAAKVTETTPRSRREAKMLRILSNHNFLKNQISPESARNLYGEFETGLNWDAHYWLHRGALELEMDELQLAENFLSQARSLRPNDDFIDTEWAYLLFKQAVKSSSENSSKEKIETAVAILTDIIERKPSKAAHAVHVLGHNGIKWSNVGLQTTQDKRDFLEMLQAIITPAAQNYPDDDRICTMTDQLNREILKLAVSASPD